MVHTQTLSVQGGALNHTVNSQFSQFENLNQTKRCQPVGKAKTPVSSNVKHSFKIYLPV